MTQSPGCRPQSTVRPEEDVNVECTVWVTSAGRASPSTSVAESHRLRMLSNEGLARTSPWHWATCVAGPSTVP